MGAFKKRQYHLQGTPYAACLPTADSLLKIITFSPEIVSIIAKTERALARLKRTWELTPRRQEFEQLITKYDFWRSLQMDIATLTQEVFLSPHQSNAEFYNSLAPNYSSYSITAAKEGMSLDFIRNVAAHITGDQNISHFRNTQIWIGGNTPKNAEFIPPHPKDIEFVLQNILTLQEREDTYPPSFLIACVFALFFLTLPFATYNARINRYLTNLSISRLMETNGIALPLSQYLSRYLHPLNTSLLQIYHAEDTQSYLLQFLGILEEAALQTANKIVAMDQEYTRLQSKMQGNKVTLAAQEKVLHFLVSTPYIQVKDIMRITGLSKPNASILVNKLAKNNVISVCNDAERGRVFYLKTFCDILS